MRFLDEHRRRPALLADHLPWAALVAPGVVLNKDGSFTAALSFRGPDLDSSEDEELMAVRARLNNALRRLGTGWCLHVEARRRPADPYPPGQFANPACALIDAERRERFESQGAAFETDYRACLTWLPAGDETRRLEAMLFEGLDRHGVDWRGSLEAFQRQAGAVFDLMAETLPETRLLENEELLSWLHACVSPRSVDLALPATPMFLDAWLADAPLTGGASPRLGDQALRIVSIRGLPADTRPGLLDALGRLPFGCRWTVRWIALDKADAERELIRLRKRWFAKRKGMGVLLREAVTREEVPLIDTDAQAKAAECDGALEALGADACAYGYLTVTVTVMAQDEAQAQAQARQVEAAINAQGFLARTEDLNAVEAWLGSLPGETYADVRRPLVSSLNLADLLPVSAVWAGPREDRRLAGPPLTVAMSEGGTPFRFSLHVGDVGHAMVVGPTGAGKSALLSFLALQWFRYPSARVVMLDKGRSARAATLAAGGRWHGLEPGGGGLSLQPLARIDDLTERAWAAEWLADTVAGAGSDIDAAQREEIWSALAALAEAPPEQRTLTVFRALVQSPTISAALEPLTLAGPAGALLDGAAEVDLDAAFACFEMESLMAMPSAAAPTLKALFHLIERDLDGRPVLLILDEAWLFLDDPLFSSRIREWLKTLRKKKTAVVFATQSLEDVAASRIAPALIENCPTQIFLPNPRALEPSSAAHYRAFGLNRRQLELIAWAAPKRAYYVRQPQGRRLIDLKLEGAALALCGASSTEDQTLISSVLDRAGPDLFAREFLKAKGVLHVDDVFDAVSTDAP